jgi:phosphopantetheinyl transferase
MREKVSPPTNNEVHVWGFNAASDARLPLSEQKKRWRQQTHEWLKLVLSQYESAEPLRLVRESSGRPVLVTDQQPSENLSVSLSHSGPHAVFAVGNVREIGVDLERMVPRSNFISLFEHIGVSFDENEERIASLFYSVWTNLEALTKAQGNLLWDMLGVAKQFYDLAEIFDNERYFISEINGEKWRFLNKMFHHHLMLSLCTPYQGQRPVIKYYPEPLFNKECV